jgi:hypothetical protein
MHTWAIYIDHARLLVDAVDEGPEPAGASGSNWQHGYTEADARATVAEHLARGYGRGSETNPRY